MIVQGRFWDREVGCALPSAALFAACLALSTPVHAETTSAEKTAADALFDAARKDMDAQNYAAACPKLAESQKLDPGVGTLLNLAKCYELLGKSASAWSTFREAASSAQQAGQREREQFARSESQRLEAVLTRVVVTVAEAVHAVPELKVEFDGRELPMAVWGVAVPVDPGDYVVRATAPGYLPFELSLRAAAGATRPLEVRVNALQPADGSAPKAPLAPPPATGAPEPEVAPPPPVEPAPQAARVETPRAAPKAHRGPGPAPWVLGGLGVAAAGVGTAFAILGNSANQTALGICPDYAQAGCPADQIREWRDRTSTASLDYTVAYIGWGVGGAAAIGAAIWLFAGSPSKAASHATWVVPSGSPEGASLTVRGRF